MSNKINPKSAVVCSQRLRSPRVYREYSESVYRILSQAKTVLLFHLLSMPHFYILNIKNLHMSPNIIQPYQLDCLSTKRYLYEVRRHPDRPIEYYSIDRR